MPKVKRAKSKPEQPAIEGLTVPAVMRTNRLYYGDNLTIMQKMATASVDMIYLDPPFNSQRTYNLLYKQLTGLPVPEQEEAFCDAWDLDPVKDEMARNIHVELRRHDVPDDVVAFWQAWMSALRSTQPRLLAYLVYMTYRLFEMRRILKPTGSIYLHCDPAASHYIKVMMDGVFGHANFLNEIIWRRTSAHSSAKRYGPVHDVILYYANGSTTTWNPSHQPYDADYIKQRFARGADRPWKDADLTGAGTRNGETGKAWRGFDPTAKGRHWAYPPSELDRLDSEGRIYWPKKQGGWPRFKRYLDEAEGIPLQDVWTDIYPVNSQAEERLGYPTQKPLTLLDRIIRASTNPGDVVFDPFCGCGTAVYASHLAGRHWIGCDIAILSVRIVEDTLLKRYGLIDSEHYDISGVPLSVDAATDLFERDRQQFQHWAVELAGGFCNNRYSGDQGVDGRLYYGDPSRGLRSMVLSVKGGQVAPAFVRELVGTLEMQGAQMAGFICLQEPTKGMKDIAAKGGMIEHEGAKYPRVQIRTVGDLLAGRFFDTPARARTLSWERQTKLAL